MNIWLPILIGVAVAAFVVFLVLRKKKAKAESSWTLPTETRARRIMRSTTPVVSDKFKIYYESGQHRPSITQAFIDGVNKCDEKGLCAGYPVERNNMPCSVVVFDAEPDASGNPAFKVPIQAGNYYWNTETDKMRGQGGLFHYILVAGQLVGTGTPDGFICVVAYPQPGQENYFAACVEYEREHDLLIWFDMEKYEATKDHGTTGHPIIPECPGFGERKPIQMGLCKGIISSAG